MTLTGVFVVGMLLLQLSSPRSSLSSATSLTVPSAHPYHNAVPNGSTCSLHVPRHGGVVTARGGGSTGSGRRSSSPDDDSAALVDNRSDEESDGNEGATRTALLLSLIHI